MNSCDCFIIWRMKSLLLGFSYFICFLGEMYSNKNYCNVVMYNYVLGCTRAYLLSLVIFLMIINSGIDSYLPIWWKGVSDLICLLKSPHLFCVYLCIILSSLANLVVIWIALHMKRGLILFKAHPAQRHLCQAVFELILCLCWMQQKSRSHMQPVKYYIDKE